MKNFILGTIGLILMISAFYFTANSQTVLELALWCLFFTIISALLIAYAYKVEQNNSFKESLLDIAPYFVFGGIFCFGGLYFYLF